jgi:hypothetical protein
MEPVLIGFAAWSFCVLVCLIFVAAISRSGQLEDQAQHAARTGFIVQPRSPLDDAIDAAVAWV